MRNLASLFREELVKGWNEKKIEDLSSSSKAPSIDGQAIFYLDSCVEQTKLNLDGHNAWHDYDISVNNDN